MADKMEEALFQHLLVILFASRHPYFSTTQELVETTTATQTFLAHVLRITSGRQTFLVSQALKTLKWFSHQIRLEILPHKLEALDMSCNIQQQLKLKVIFFAQKSEGNNAPVTKEVDITCITATKVLEFDLKQDAFGNLGLIRFELQVYPLSDANTASGQCLGTREIWIHRISIGGMWTKLSFDNSNDIHIKLGWRRKTVLKQFPAMHLKLLLALMNHEIDRGMAPNPDIWKFDTPQYKAIDKCSECLTCFCICNFTKSFLTDGRTRELVDASGQFFDLRPKQFLQYILVATALIIKERFVEARFTMNTCTNLLQNLISDLLASQEDQMNGIKAFWENESTVLLKEAFDILLVIPFQSRDQNKFDLNVYFYPYSSFVHELRAFAALLLHFLDPDFTDERQYIFANWTEDVSRLLSVTINRENESIGELKQHLEDCSDDFESVPEEVIQCQITK